MRESGGGEEEAFTKWLDEYGLEHMRRYWKNGAGGGGRALEPLVGSRYSRRGGGAQGLKEWLDEERCYYMRGGAGVMRCWRRGGDAGGMDEGLDYWRREGWAVELQEGRMCWRRVVEEGWRCWRREVEEWRICWRSD